jgi:hypothetical protein
VSHSTNELTIVVEPSTGILRVAWARPLLTAGLIDSYYHLLEEAAIRSRCRFWHLDLRPRIWPAATFMKWMADTFAPAAVQRLGGSVYVACWIGPKHHLAVEQTFTLAMQRQAAELGFHLLFFKEEAAARAWLLHQQAHDADRRQVA